MLKVLVTGGAGYIGSRVVEELLNRGHKPHVFDTLFWGKEPLEPFLNDIELIEGDCRNSRDVIHALDDVESVLHLAGIVGEAACLKNPKAHFSVNLESTRTLINCCTDPSLELVRDFVFSSSCSVYGNVEDLYSEVSESTPTHPLSAYAHAKKRSEEVILERGGDVSHFHPTVLRLSTVFGWSRRPRLDLVTNLFTYQAWKDQEITIYGTGEQYRSLVHVEDVARAFVDVLEAPRFKRDNEIFHVGDKQNNKTITEIAEIVADFVPDTEINYNRNADTDRRDYSINCRKIQNIIGWEADWSVEDGIQDLLENLESKDWDWENDRFRNSSYDYR